jgi:hypothetical protein
MATVRSTNPPNVQQAIDAVRQFFTIAEGDPVLYQKIVDVIPIDLAVRLKGLVSVLK